MGLQMQQKHTFSALSSRNMTSNKKKHDWTANLSKGCEYVANIKKEMYGYTWRMSTKQANGLLHSGIFWKEE